MRHSWIATLGESTQKLAINRPKAFAFPGTEAATSLTGMLLAKVIELNVHSAITKLTVILIT